MRKLWVPFLLVLFAVWFGGCKDSPPPVEPPPDQPPVEEPPPTVGCVPPELEWKGQCRVAQDYYKLWDAVKDTEFGHWGNYYTATYNNALHQTRSDLWNDGVKNVYFAVGKCPNLFPWNGVTKDDALEVAKRSEAAVNRLMGFIDIDPFDARTVHGGNWVVEHPLFPGRSMVRKDFFDSWWDNEVVPLAHAGNAPVPRLNGVAGACKDQLTTGPLEAVGKAVKSVGRFFKKVF